MKKKGFTLIELLVCIAIVAMLLALLWPAFQRIQRNNSGEPEVNTSQRFQMTRESPGGFGEPDVLVIKDLKTDREYIAMPNYDITLMPKEATP